MLLGRALRIQRLEGSRPGGRLCTLNGAERVHRFKWAAVIGMICRFEVLVKRRSIAQRRSAWAEEMSNGALRARRDNGSPCVPEHEQRPTMWTEVHAAHWSG